MLVRILTGATYLTGNAGLSAVSVQQRRNRPAASGLRAQQSWSNHVCQKICVTFAVFITANRAGYYQNVYGCSAPGSRLTCCADRLHGCLL